MQYTNIKTICQVIGKSIVIVLFSCFFSFSVFGQAVPLDITQLQKQAAQDLADLVEEIITTAKKGALTELKTGKYKKLYDSKNPSDIAEWKKIEKAVITLIDANRAVIYTNIIAMCRASRADIKACDPKSRAEAAGKIIDSVLRNVATARENGGNQLDQMIIITEAHTAQQIAIDRLAMNIVQLQAAQADLIVQRGLVDKYILKTEEAIREAGLFNRRIFVLKELRAGLRDLQDARALIGSAIHNVGQTINDLARIRRNLERQLIKPADVDRLLAEANNDLLAVKKDTDGIKRILNRATLAWLVEKYNELNPAAPINLADMQKKTDDRLKPLDTILQSLKNKEMQDMLKKLKAALAVPGIDPSKPLIDQLKIEELRLPKPSSSSGNPSGTIIGVDGIPVISGPGDPFIAMPPQDAVRITLERDPRGRPIRQYDGTFVFREDGKSVRHGTGKNGTKKVEEFLKNPQEGALLYIYTDPATGNKIIDVYVPPEKRAGGENGTLK